MPVENNSKVLQYILYFSLFIIGQTLSMWGQYVTLPYKNLTYLQGLTMALPYAWVDWIFMTFAINIGHTYELVTPTQDTFLLIIVQFSLLLLINKFYLKQEIYRSDIIAFFIIIAGYICSFFHIVSKIFNIPIPKHSTAENPDEAHANPKIRVYHAIAETTPSPLSNTDDVKKDKKNDKKKDKKKKSKNNGVTQQA
uniref:Uncharacterized protein n=1 Tax=viral metagenome TaxID=1070528 RepID=A0A6C0EVU2_9ZZZZ